MGGPAPWPAIASAFRTVLIAGGAERMRWSYLGCDLGLRLHALGLLGAAGKRRPSPLLHPRNHDLL